MRVNSIFVALEGEGIRIGTLQTFVRFQGCNGGKGFCKVCDTPEALSLNGGKVMDVNEIMDEVMLTNPSWVSLTGGCVEEQPTEELLRLIQRLQEQSINVNVEASGQYVCDWFKDVDFISCDIKTPCTGIKQDLRMIKRINDRKYYSVDDRLQFKMIVKDKKDFKFVEKVLSEIPNIQNLVITPCWEVNGKLNTKFIDWMIKQIKEKNMDVRLIIQQHKVIYSPKKRGV